MAVSLPTAADVRKVREQAAKTAAERAEVAKTPLLAVLGAGDYAVTTVTKVWTDAQTFVQALPQRLKGDELRKTAVEAREQAEQQYAELAERGEQTWGRIRKQPQVKQAIATVEAYTEQLDTRVDAFVDDAHDAAEKVLATVTRQTRSTGEKVARTTQKVAAEAAETVSEVASEVSNDIAEAGDEAAHATRSATRRAANRTAPKAATRKPAARRTNGSTAK